METITGNEQTFDIASGTDVQVDGVVSFQNISNNTLRWSTAAFSSTNRGSILNPFAERVLSAGTTVYFRADDGIVHCRSVAL